MNNDEMIAVMMLLSGISILAGCIVGCFFWGWFK